MCVVSLGFVVEQLSVTLHPTGIHMGPTKGAHFGTAVPGIGLAVAW